MEDTLRKDLKIKNTPINEKAYIILKEAIIKQKLDGSKTLNETELAELLGISRTPLREALKKLEADGFIIRKPNNRIMITKLSIKHAENLYMVRSRLEGLTAAMAAENLTNEEIENMEHLLAQSIDHWEREEFEKFDEIGREFHKIIHKASTNEVCEFILKTLQDHINRYRWISIKSYERPKEIIEEHRRLIDSLKQGDSSLAENVMKAHIMHSGKMVLKNLEKIF